MIANEVVLEMKYTRIIKLYAEQENISLEKAMNVFYNSKTFELISEEVADMHCRSDQYLVNE